MTKEKKEIPHCFDCQYNFPEEELVFCCSNCDQIFCGDCSGLDENDNSYCLSCAVDLGVEIS